MKKRSNIIKLGILTVVLITATNLVSAQHDHGGHNHGGSHETHAYQSPHGGELLEVGKYKVEMVTNLFLKEDQLMIYLFKGSLKPLSIKEITGNITIDYKDGTSSTDSLKAKGTEFFVAQLQSTESFSCTVSVTIKGKIFSAVFHHKGFGSNATNNYSCPMHPEIESDSKGNCPKCGMKLE